MVAIKHMKAMKANKKQLKKPMEVKKVKKSVFHHVKLVADLVGLRYADVATTIQGLMLVAADALTGGEVFELEGPVEFVLKPTQSKKAMKAMKTASPRRIWDSTSSSSAEEVD